MKNFYRGVIDAVLIKIENELDTISVEEVMQFCGFSYFHFHRLFCAYTKESVKQYLKRMRLERSAHDLNYKHMPITQVALDAGFATPSAFNKAFKEMFGVTPSEYKKYCYTKRNIPC